MISPKIARYTFNKISPRLKVVTVPRILNPQTTTRPVPQIKLAYLAAFKTLKPNNYVSAAFSDSVLAPLEFMVYSSKSPLIFYLFF